MTLTLKKNEFSDGYHSFSELYDSRKMYNAALFNEWAKNYDADYSGLNRFYPFYSKMGSHYNVHKSWMHHNGEYCFPNSRHRWFIVCAKLPLGLISNHYKEEDWDLFKIPETEKALFPFDGHTGKDVIERLKSIL